MKYISKNCFKDKEIIAFIETKGKLGNCDFCYIENTYVIESNELLDFFKSLIDCFQANEDGKELFELIQSNWSFFSNSKSSKLLLDYYLEKLESDIPSHLTKVKFSNDILDNVNYWDTLKENIKWHKRFITNINELEDLGWDGFFNSQFKLKKDNYLFRARLHHKSDLEPYSKEDMLSPPRDISKGGRANPSGIPYLYLCDNPKTVLFETRASYLDELTVGKFRIKDESLEIVDFTEEMSLFYQNDDIAQMIKIRLLKDKISKDLSKPMRRYDSEIDYIPTQFICEYIRIITGADGICFRSSLHPEGKNFVIFEDKKMQCIEVKKSKIIKIEIESDYQTLSQKL